jgi:hypothetical protein
VPQPRRHHKFNDLWDKKYRQLDSKEGGMASAENEEEVVVDLEDAKEYRDYHDVRHARQHTQGARCKLLHSVTLRPAATEATLLLMVH